MHIVVRRTLSIVVLAVMIAAIVILSRFGLALWVFLPLLPAAILLILILTVGRHQPAAPEAPAKPESQEKSDEDKRKAA